MPRHFATLAVLSGLALVSCAHTTPGPGAFFLHDLHRETFALESADLSRAKFYVSQDVLAKSQPAEEGAAEDPVVFATMNEVGKLVGEGTGWLRIGFGGDGSGIAFVVNPDSPDQSYYLATEVEGQPGLHMVKDLDEKLLIHDGQRYEIAFGARTQLLINSEDLLVLMEARRSAWSRGRQ